MEKAILLAVAASPCTATSSVPAGQHNRDGGPRDRVSSGPGGRARALIHCSISAI